MLGAGERQTLENIGRWRMAGAGEGKGLEDFVLQPPTLPEGTEKGETLSQVGSRASRC
jgi:hypothetical protein